MATFSHEHLAFVFGVLGNLISFLVYLAPLVTFYDIYKRGSTQNYHAIPYSVALFSSMLMLYYAHLKGNEYLVLTINSFGCAIEATYLVIFFTFANSRARMATSQLIIVFNAGGYICLILLTCMVSPPHRLKLVGWICAAFSVCVFAAPLSVMRTVINTKSVEFMPFPLSFCLTQSAVAWFCYGMFSHDYFIAGPNVLGFLFGAAQIILYFIYKKVPARREEEEPSQTQEGVIAVANETLVHGLYLVTGEIIEFVDYVKEDDNEEKATTLKMEPASKMDELQINGVTVNNAIVHDQIHLKAGEGEEIVEILEHMTMPENSTVIDVGQGAPLEPSVDNV